MGRARTLYRCTECGTEYPKWAGQCTACDAWNTLVDEEVAAPGVVVPAASGVAQPIAEIAAEVLAPHPTGVGELDRVLGGGVVDGAVTLLGGEPGIGKSTLLLQLLAGWPTRTLYVTGEESTQQVRLRAERLGAVQPHLWLLAETSLPHVLAAIEQVQPRLVVVDSIQTIADPEVPSAPGSVSQVRSCAHRLVAEAKRRGVPMILVGHVTK
ncbi:MAG TPA: DNA repair protein RadA, partial [Acidimicrobiaceae bacterium]|nr:DNA repair protein RadA [Acidimicrobiaceae bacterium]